MHRIVRVLVVTGLVAVPFASGGTRVAAADATVVITDRVTPATLSITPGTTVTFRNDDGDRHRMRTVDGPAEFDSDNLDPGAAWAVTLDLAGTYRYVDHRNDDDPAYHGTITVGASGTAGGGGSGGGGSGDPGGGAVPAPPPSAVSVAVLDRSFSPSNAVIAPGGTVTWQNQSSREHTVTGSGFDSGTLGGGASFSHTFPSPGTFRYICEFHGDMQGSVTVTDDGAGPEPDPTPGTTAPAGPSPTGGGPSGGSPTPAPAPAPAAGAGSAAVRHSVDIVDFAFRPASLHARVGDTVRWTNRGPAPHTATAAGAFDTGILRTGNQADTLLRAPGTFSFRCSLHPEMAGVLVVEAAADSPVPPAMSPSPARASGETPGAATRGTGPDAGDGDVGAPLDAHVAVVDFAFEPASVRVVAGGSVSWTVDGVAPHTVTADDKTFTSDLLQPGATFTRTFPEPGTYPYLCALHPSMRGAVEVVAAAAGVAAESSAGADAGRVDGRRAAEAALDTAPASRADGSSSLLAALLGGTAILAGTGALLYGSSRLLAVDRADTPGRR